MRKTTRLRVARVLMRKGAPIGLTALAQAVGRPRSEVRSIVRDFIARGITRSERPPGAARHRLLRFRIVPKEASRA